MQEFKFEITKDEVAMFGNQRLDKFLTDKFRPTNPEITRSKIQNLIQEGLIENQDGKKITDNSYKIKSGELLIVKVPAPKPSHLIAKEIDFKII